MSVYGSNDTEHGLVDAVVSASLRHRPTHIRAALDTATRALGLGRCVDGVVLPAIRQFALRPPEDVDVQPATRLAVETVRAWLEALTAAAPTPDSGRPLILACGPGERHSVGLEALALLLRYRRRRCRMLGTRVSARSMSIAVEVNRPAGVVVASQLESACRQSTHMLQALNDIGITTFYAGAAFDTPATRSEVAGTYLGTSLDNACTTIIRTLAQQMSDRPSRTE